MHYSNKNQLQQYIYKSHAIMYSSKYSNKQQLK